MNAGDIVSVVTMSGEYVGKLEEHTDDFVSLADPRMLVMNQEGMGFAHGLCVTGEKDPKEVKFKNYVLCTLTNQQVSDAWRAAVTGIVL